jgi:hypothetical protein
MNEYEVLGAEVADADWDWGEDTVTPKAQI